MKPTIINHKIYGRFTISEPVLIDLIKSPALQRLKKIAQLGAWHFYHQKPGNFNRYQHSIGVLLLLRKYGASLEEQTAGLLHDISHTAFSHVIDRVYGRELYQDYQDSRLKKAFELQGINKILKHHGLKPKKILDFSKFTLLEKELPDLCADRIDYTLQDPIAKYLLKNKTQDLIKKLIVYQNHFVFANVASAKKFSYLYLKLNKVVWCNPLQSSLYWILADTIKLSLAKKIINKKDLFTTDDVVMKKLKLAKDSEINQQLKTLKKLKIKIVEPKKADLILKTKFRIVDPPLLQNGKLIRLSKIDPNYRRQINDFRKQATNGFCVKILNSK
ncbi:MAG: HD domain-containing protein [Patescibacteria group bacterium]